MAEEKAQGSQGFWTSMPGTLTAVAAVITAAAGLLATLKQSDKAAAAPPEERTATRQIDGATTAPVKRSEATSPGRIDTGGQTGASNGFDIVSVTPNVGSPLTVGRPAELAVAVRYKLATAPQAVFGVYLEEYPPGDSTCSGNVHHTNGGKLVPVTSGSDAFQVILKWRRNAGDIYKNGSPADHGFLSVGSNLWQDGSGREGTLIHAFGTSSVTCIPYS